MCRGRIWRVLLVLLLVCKKSLIGQEHLNLFVFDKRYIHYRINLTLSGRGGVESLRVLRPLRKGWVV